MNFNLYFLILAFLISLKRTTAQLECNCACNQSLIGVASLTYICRMKSLTNETMFKFKNIPELKLSNNRIESIFIIQVNQRRLVSKPNLITSFIDKKKYKNT